MNTMVFNFCAPRRFLALPLTLCLALLFALSACSEDNVSGNTVSCEIDFDCPLGTVCGASNVCIEAACEFCTDGQICYKTDANPEGTCSAPECSFADDCPGDIPCNNGVCGGDAAEPECSLSNPCPEGQVCNWAQKCVPEASSGSCTGTDDCGDGEFCDPQTDSCLPAVSCDNVQCDPGEVCIEGYGTCQPDGNTCTNITPADCSGATPHLDQQSCTCVSCTSSSHCGAGQACVGGTCQTNTECATPCSPDAPGTCGGDTPYCINNCCIQCLGAADCSGNQLCLDGFCSAPPSCAADPNACPAGFECINGTCAQPGGGQDCSSDPSVCTFPMVCDPSTNTCTGLGGDMGCGFCDPDCTCPNGLTCQTDGMMTSLMPMCVGCSPMGGLFGGASCPAGQECSWMSFIFAGTFACM